MAHRLVYHSTLGWRVIIIKRLATPWRRTALLPPGTAPEFENQGLGCRVVFRVWVFRVWNVFRDWVFRVWTSGFRV